VEESFTLLSPSISGSSQSKERTFWYKNMRRQLAYNMHNRKLFGLVKWMKYILQSAQRRMYHYRGSWRGFLFAFTNPNFD
jgi:hypothetical protein